MNPRRWLPRKLALAIGLVSAGVRLALQRSRGVSYSLPEAIGSFCSLIPATVGTHNLCYDIAAVKRLIVLLEPLTSFGEGHIATLMYRFACGQLAMAQSREADARAVLEELDAGAVNCSPDQPHRFRLVGKLGLFGRDFEVTRSESTSLNCNARDF